MSDMARYIDADELYKAAQKRIAEANEARMAVVDDEFLDLINDAFTEDVAPRAEWISVEERLPEVAGRAYLVWDNVQKNAKKRFFYRNNVVLNTVGVSSYNAPFLVGALLATADAVCEGIAKGDEGTAEHLMRAARDVAGFLAERRKVRVVEEKEDEHD